MAMNGKSSPICRWRPRSPPVPPDAGLGIYSAAASYGLDFIPVCVEQYDILMDETFTQSTLFDAFASIIRSKEFEERLTQLGGYTFTDTGKMVEYLD